MLNLIAKVLIAPIIFMMSLAGYAPLPTTSETPVLSNLGGFNTTAGGTYRLGNSISSTDTSIKLSSFTEPISSTKYTMAMLNTDVAYGTIAPQSTQSELISFTGITQNADGSATLTGVSRGLSRSYPYTASSTFRMAHAGQSIFILSDAPGLFNEYVTKRNDETISGSKTFTATTTFASTTIVSTTPTTATMVANKGYVDTSIGNATTTINNAVVHLAGIETVTGAKTFTATSTFATSTFNGLVSFLQNITVPLIPVASTDATSKNYVDTISIAGAPIADNTTTGIARKASSTQIASGFSSTTPYFIPSSLASSTASTTSKIVVVTNGNGVIDSSFIASTSVSNITVANLLAASTSGNLMTSNGSAWVSQSPNWYLVKKTSTESTSGTTFIDDAQLKFSFEANTTYSVKIRFMFDSGGSSGVKLQLFSTQALSAMQSNWIIATGGTGSEFVRTVIKSATATNHSYTKAVTSNQTIYGEALIDLYVTTSSTPGVLSIQWACEGGVGNPFGALLGSTLEYTKII